MLQLLLTDQRRQARCRFCRGSPPATLSVWWDGVCDSVVVRLGVAALAAGAGAVLVVDHLAVVGVIGADGHGVLALCAVGAGGLFCGRRSGEGDLEVLGLADHGTGVGDLAEGVGISKARRSSWTLTPEPAGLGAVLVDGQTVRTVPAGSDLCACAETRRRCRW